MTAATAAIDRMLADLKLADRCKDAELNTIARRCSQPGCIHSAGWLLRVAPRRVRPLCTRDLSRRLRRRALPKRGAR